MNMEKARLEIKKTKKGYAVNLIFETGKSLPLTDIKLQDDKLNGKEVEVLRESGQVKKILCDGNVIYEKSKGIGKTNQSVSRPPTPSASQAYSRSNSPQNTGSNIDAVAPYNFIPLNDTVVPAESVPTFDVYHPDRLTGYIDIEIETKTPLYIRDCLNNTELAERDRIDEMRKTNKSIAPFANPDFFSPAGQLRIPGSSLRGMVRTMVEIVSFGKFGFFEDKRLYYRGLADMSGIRKEYQNEMSSFDKNSNKANYKMSAGYIYKKGLKYYIHPAKSYKQIKKEVAKNLIAQKKYKYEVFKSYEMDNGYIVVSGNMQNKKNDWFIDLPDNNAQAMELSKADVLDYKNDSNRHKEAPDLIALSAKGRTPCFYTLYKDTHGKNRIAFGHTAMFRLPYERTIGDHIPPALKDPGITDIAEAIFGNEKTFASRVFFEDALCLSSKEDALMGEAVPKILSEPKPTTFQHYLEQGQHNLVNHPKNLAHYNSNTNIRGYKLYWHKDGTGWEETNNEAITQHPSQYTKINPVKPGIKFNGRIRFENLSAVELGALLFALDLPKGCCHKLGMAKPLGLGSIRITPKLYLSDRTGRYSALFKEWEDPIDECSEKQEYSDAFEKYVIKEARLEKTTTLWESDRLKELKAMLDFDNKPSNNKTRYMEIERVINGKKTNEFKNRPVLPRPSEVKG